MLVRVGELAGRVGFPMPAVSEVECVEGEECVSLRVGAAGGTTLALHSGFEERFPAGVVDFLVAQALVQARQGVFRQLQWIKTGRTVLGVLVGALAVLLTAQLLEPLWLAFLVAMAVGYVVGTAINLLIAMIWGRWFSRRSDRTLVDVLGKAHVVETLRWYADCPRPPLLRYLKAGAPPTVAERLRWLKA
jgi:hypothetical protein